MTQHILTLHRLRIFEAVVEHGSFNRAAHTLLLSQSAVSQHIQQLESGLQAQLFTRGPQGVVLTATGMELYQHSQRILQAVETATQAVLSQRDRVEQQLTISASSGIAVYVLPPIMRRFQGVQPDVTLSLVTNPTMSVLKGVAEGNYDIGLVAGGCDDLDDRRVAVTVLRHFAYQVVVHPEHRWAGQASVTAVSLAQEPFLNRQPNSRTRVWQEAQLAEHGIQVNTTTELDSPGTIKYALLSNMGVSILPEYTVAREVERGELWALKIEGVTLLRPLLLLQQRARAASLVHEAFKALIAGEAKGGRKNG